MNYKILKPYLFSIPFAIAWFGVAMHVIHLDFWISLLVAVVILTPGFVLSIRWSEKAKPTPKGE